MQWQNFYKLIKAIFCPKCTSCLQIKFYSIDTRRRDRDPVPYGGRRVARRLADKINDSLRKIRMDERQEVGTRLKYLTEKVSNLIV